MQKTNLDIFYSYFSTSLCSGIPICESLLNFSSSPQCDEKFQKILSKVIDDIRRGASLVESFEEHSLCDPLILEVLKKGEEEGILVESLKNIGMRLSYLNDISKFFFDFQLLLKSGTPILDALQICAHQLNDNKKLFVAIRKIRDEISRGSTIFEAFSQHPKLFNELVLPLIEIGEISCNLAEQCLECAELLNKQHINKILSKNTEDKSNENFKDQNVFEKWIDTNPFPLAIVLREYISLKDDDLAKFRLLLKFFECAVAFLSTIYFGAFRENEKKFSLIKNVLKDDKKIQFKRLTFGDWVQIYALISKQTRILLDQDKELCKDIFNDNELLLPKVLSNKKLVNIFLSALEIRNTQEAHGSWVDAEEAVNMNNKLFKLLELFKNNMGDIWDKKELIRVESSEVFSEQKILHQYSNLMGSHTIFKRKSKNIPYILFKDNLYLISSMNLRPIKLEIFMQIAEAPKKIKNACYFYNKINSEGKPHFISYHYSNTIEGTHSNQLLDLISEFE